LPLIQRCPTSTLGSNKYSDLFPHSSTGGVGISSDEMKRGADLPLPNPFQFVRVIDLTSQFVVVPKKSITLPPYRSSGTVACPAAPSLVPYLYVREGNKLSLLPFSVWLLRRDVGPLSFALGRWSPQHSILGENSPLIGYQQADPTTRAICQQALLSPHSLDSWRSRSGLQQWAQRAWRGQPPNHAALTDLMGLYKLRRSSLDDKSRGIFFVGLGISLSLISTASMAPSNTSGT
jgi:hypothetical protein